MRDVLSSHIRERGFHSTIVPILTLYDSFSQWEYLLCDLLVLHGVDINIRDVYGRTILAFAISRKASCDVFEYYLKNGVDPLIRDRYGKTAWEYYFKCPGDPRNYSCLLVLLKYGGCPMMSFCPETHGYVYSSAEELIRDLCEPTYRVWPELPIIKKMLTVRVNIFIMCIPCFLPRYQNQTYLPIDCVRKVAGFLFIW